MTSRLLRSSWLAVTFLVPLMLWSQTSPTAQTTTTGQAIAIGQPANPPQPAASVPEIAEPGLKYDLSIPIIDRSIGRAVQATPSITCKQACRNEDTVCLRSGQPPALCTKNLNACLHRCG